MEDLIADQQIEIAITKSGYIKSLPLSTYRMQRRGGGRGHRDGHEGRRLHRAPLRLLDPRLPALLHQPRQGLPLEGLRATRSTSRTAKGRSLDENVLPLRDGERVQSVLNTRDFTEGKYLVFATRKGQSKTEFLAYNTPIKADGIIAINGDDDELIAVRRTGGDDDIIMVSRSGQASRFHESRAGRWGGTPPGCAA